MVSFDVGVDWGHVAGANRVELGLAQLFHVQQLEVGPLRCANQLVEFELQRLRVERAIMNVTTVVPVLMTSCHVSE